MRRACVRVRACVSLCACMLVCGCVCVCVKCGNEGVCLCTSLNYNCITVLKKHSNIHIKRTAWVISCYHTTHILYTLRNTACLVPPQQFQIDILIPGSEIVELSVAVFGVIFSSPKCNRSKWYHIWCPTCGCLLYPLSSSNLSSLLSSFPCLLKDHFACRTHWQTRYRMP